MTIIAYDGKNICIDCQITNDDVKKYGVKYKLVKGELLTYRGMVYLGQLMTEWYINGCNKDDLPKLLDEEDYVDFLVFPVKGNPLLYCDMNYIPIPVLKTPDAWGSGKPFAMGAMLAGKSARESVEIASMIDTYCGLGDVLFQNDGKGWKLIEEREYVTTYKVKNMGKVAKK